MVSPLPEVVFADSRGTIVDHLWSTNVVASSFLSLEKKYCWYRSKHENTLSVWSCELLSASSRSRTSLTLLLRSSRTYHRYVVEIKHVSVTPFSAIDLAPWIFHIPRNERTLPDPKEERRRTVYPRPTTKTPVATPLFAALALTYRGILSVVLAPSTMSSTSSVMRIRVSSRRCV